MLVASLRACALSKCSGAATLSSTLCATAAAPLRLPLRAHTRRMYLKFTVIWRFFRVWALLDGVCVPLML